MCDRLIVACEQTLEAGQQVVIAYGKPPQSSLRACVTHQLQHDLMRMPARRFVVGKLRALGVKKRSLAVYNVEIIKRHPRLDLCTDCEERIILAWRASGKRRGGGTLSAFSIRG